MRLHLLAAALAAAFFPWRAAWAQPESGTLAPVTVTGNPLGSSDVAAPVSTLSGTGLLLRQQPSLGETLSTLPGVSSTYFGPVASRPIVRGLDGDRIRILQNGTGLLDLSSLSPDHAVTANPLSLERIEVLRGPAALLYGGNAIGGVVHLLDNRIPRDPVQGVHGRADVSLATGSRERAGALMVEGGNGRVALHADAFGRSARDTRVPTELACTQGGVTTLARRLCNSDAQAEGGALGASWFHGHGHVGASFGEYRTDYGSVAEDEVRLDMRSQRFSLEGELRDLPGWVRSLKGWASRTQYRHTEADAGVPATLFRHQGNDFRLEARHRALGPLEGVIGLQVDSGRLSAQGAEAYLPPNRTRQRALFLHEEWATGWGKLTFGARRERVDVQSSGDPALPRFAPASRQFSPSSWSAGAIWKLAPAWQLTGSFSRTQRAPKDYELFADGPHAATGAYEVGNATLGRERSTSAEVGVQWTSGPHRFKAGVFQSRFRDYVALLATGIQRDAAGNGAGVGVTDCGDGTSVESGCAEEILPEFAYQQVAARFRGLEAESTVRLLQGGPTLDLETRLDLVRADNLTAGQPLPRISPARAGAALAWGTGPWSVRVGFDHWARQRRVPAGELPVAGYTLWHAAVSYRVKAGPTHLLWYARLDNTGDRLAYPATSILTQSAPGRVPLPGRSLRVGVRADF